MQHLFQYFERVLEIYSIWAVYNRKSDFPDIVKRFKIAFVVSEKEPLRLRDN